MRQLRKYVQLLIVLAVFSALVLFRHFRDQQSTPALAHRAEVRTQPSDDPIPPPVTTATAIFVPATPVTTPTTPPTPMMTPTTLPTPSPTVTPAPATPTPLSTEPTATPQPDLTPTAASTPVIRLVRRSPIYFDSSRFKDGAFTGKAIYTQYGTMQVKVVLRQGEILEVMPVQEPRATGRSEQISGELIPLWIDEAIEKQDWDVDAVSGATITWQAFQRAMVYALRAAE